MRAHLLLSAAAMAVAAPASAQSGAPAAAAEQAVTPFDKAQAAAVVSELATQLQDNFVFPDVGKAYAAMLRRQLASGAYASFPDGKAFAEKVTADLQAVHADRHLKLLVVPPEARGGPEAEQRAAETSSSSVEKSGWLSDGVAYIRFDLFPGDEATLADLRKFIAVHRDANTLIIDTRWHRGGGLAEMDVLFPQIFAKPTVLVDMDTRVAAERNNPELPPASMRVIKGPDGVVRREHFVVPAKDQGGLPEAKIYLLTSKRTGSAAEHLALALKRTHRATLIGESTYGAGHFGGMIPLDKSFTYAAFIPMGRTFDPDTGNGWEGTGVTPDIAVAADEALDVALKQAGVDKTGAAALAALR